MPLVLSMGDPAGISAEITLKAWQERKEHALPPFFIVDDPERLRSCARDLNLPVPITTIESPGDVSEVFGRGCPVLPLGERVNAVPGEPNATFAPMILASLERAVELTVSGKAEALVTNPVSKSVLQAASFPYAGHTEYLHARVGRGSAPLMLMCSPSLKVALVTTHLPLCQVASALKTESIVRSGLLLHTGLKELFGIRNPRLAVAALNPHGGDDGLLGDEEACIIAPAVEQLRAQKINAQGPYPADTLFYAQARSTYDAVLCMYHDQALIPFKTLGFPGGANVTLGLQITRASPDHGPAFHIAGQGVADPRGLIEAVRLAGTLAQTPAQTPTQTPTHVGTV